MRITKKTIRRGGRSLEVVELIPGRAEKALRWMCGVAGLVMACLLSGMAMLLPQITEHYQIKMIILGVMVGGAFVMAAAGRRVFRSVERASIGTGMRWFGLTHWSPKVPTTKSQIFDIGRNDDAALFVSVRRPEGEVLLAIGPFMDGDQAVEAAALMNSGKKGPEEGDSQVDPLRIIQQLKGGASPAVSKLLMSLIFCSLLTPAWFDRTWFDAVLSMLIGVPLLMLAVVWITPGGGVFDNTDNGESVDFWTRHRFFGRLEYRKSLITNDAPEFLQHEHHLPSVGWVFLILIYVAVLAIWALR
jgi:hypothetical protein